MSDKPEFSQDEVPVTLTFNEWTFVSAALISTGIAPGFEVHQKIMNQVVQFTTEVNGA